MSESQLGICLWEGSHAMIFPSLEITVSHRLNLRPSLSLNLRLSLATQLIKKRFRTRCTYPLVSIPLNDKSEPTQRGCTKLRIQWGFYSAKPLRQFLEKAAQARTMLDLRQMR